MNIRSGNAIVVGLGSLPVILTIFHCRAISYFTFQSIIAILCEAVPHSNRTFFNSWNLLF
ncbi:hypothetical protein LEP1GSC070_2706 [Leptospira santarosai str. AIM]|nr:hypothetical protein LEP1GSC070_2706 [Leptospira santarosai str. AIM]